MSDALNEKDKVKETFAEKSKRLGLCTAFKVFDLGSNGTVYVGCGLHEAHEKDGEESIGYHLTRQAFADGSVVTFKWAL